MQKSIESFFSQKRALATKSEPANKKTRVEESKSAPVKAENDSMPPMAPVQPVVASSDASQSLEYGELTNVFDKIEATTKRLEITKYCSDFFTRVLETHPHQLPEITYLCINRLGPDYEGLELGIGESIIIKALAESTGRNIAQIKKDYNTLGDLGGVAIASKKSQATMFRPKPLTVDVVFKRLVQIAKSSGHQSQSKKVNIIKELLVSCRGVEAKYLVRSLEGKLRIGLAEKSVLVALGQAFVRNDLRLGRETISPDAAEELVKDVFCQLPNYETIIEAAITGGVKSIPDAVKLTPGIPLKPMLAKPTKSITEVLDRFSGEKFTCEYKYDGERAQVHCTAAGTMHVYSRNMEDMSQRYPDIIDIIPRIRTEKTVDFILDCEAVAWDLSQHKILPFQILSTRKRKDVESGDIKVKVHLFAFDILYLNGEPLLTRPLAERRKLIEDNFNLLADQFSPAVSMNSESIEEIQQFLDQSVKDSCEGLMIKMLDGTESGYEPSKRSRNWLKLKKDYLDGVGDSLDLVVLGAYFGRGKRTKVYGGFLLGAYNPDTEEYETVCKIGTGFSEADLERFYQQLSPLADPKPKSYIDHDPAANQQPDVWFEPKYVWEVLTADLSLSPVYRAGHHELGKGVSLRFPRFIREREDKGPEDSTSSEQLVQFYQRQASIAE